MTRPRIAPAAARARRRQLGGTRKRAAPLPRLSQPSTACRGGRLVGVHYIARGSRSAASDRTSWRLRCSPGRCAHSAGYPDAGRAHWARRATAALMRRRCRAFAPFVAARLAEVGRHTRGRPSPNCRAFEVGIRAAAECVVAGRNRNRSPACCRLSPLCALTGQRDRRGGLSDA
jgi:hypothetical protein